MDIDPLSKIDHPKRAKGTRQTIGLLKDQLQSIALVVFVNFLENICVKKRFKHLMQ